MAFISPVHSKLVQTDENVNGIIVKRTEFQTIDNSTDSRNELSYKDFCLGNLQALGQLGNLRAVTMQRNDVDLVIDSIQRAYEQPQTPPQNP